MVTPRRQCQTSSERVCFFLSWLQYWSKPVRKIPQELCVGGAIDKRGECLIGRRREAGQEMGSQNVEVAHRTFVQRYVLVLRSCSQGRFEVFGSNSPRPILFSKGFVWQIASSADKASSQPHRFFDMKRFQAV